MENIHAPTVPSGPTSAPTTNGIQTAGLSFAQLQAKKDNVEAEIRALSSVLDSVGTLVPRFGDAHTDSSQHGVDMNTRLITPDGFPRADLDVAQSLNSWHSELETLLIYLQSEQQDRALSTSRTTTKLL